ncbi:MAG: Inositol-phosphate phosphatase [Parcubacteria group bacterium]|nr:Inositol-phosphate phosphatase [Parcubacteria group bacterium]
MQNRYDFIISTVTEAGELVLSSKEKHLEISAKGGDSRDVLTNVDLEVNIFVTNKIKELFPGEMIYSEETEGGIAGQAAYWSIDPIDGTSNFARNIPHYATVISYIENGEAVVGAIYNPVTRELYSFEKEKGAFLDGKPIRVTDISALKDAYILLHIGRKTEVREWGLNLQKYFLEHAKKNTNLGSSALDLAFLASGRVDAVIYGTMTTADIAIATALVREAGGEVYDIAGAPITLADTPQQIIGTSTRALFDGIAAIK